MFFTRRTGWLLSANKQFKSDSARLAFLVWVEFSDYGGQIECCGCVLHTLIGRYKARRKRTFRGNSNR
ncbi:hypothetical protein BTN60_24475 [Vibrio parahaemolyticus]|nr:hypothetical protein BTN34_24585 [Vibrio parahaemolyticus]OUD67085.1 hypothetical protein BTN60_24475 [Vibrio parahaemolyticus]